MKFQWTVRFEDLLTLVTIVGSVIAFVVSWWKDRAAKRKARADEVRAKLATALAKLDRWEALHLSIFQDLQPAYIEASEKLLAKLDPVPVRDWFWKIVNGHSSRLAAKCVEEQLETTYVDLLAYFPSERRRFRDLYAALHDLNRERIGDLLEGLQNAVFEVSEGATKSGKYQTADLGEALRASARTIRIAYEADLARVLDPVRSMLLDSISLSDRDVLSVGLA